MRAKPFSDLGRPLAEGDVVRFIRRGKMGYQNRRECSRETYRKMYFVTTPVISSPGTIYDGRVGVVEAGDRNLVEHAFPREAMEYVVGYIPTALGEVVDVEKMAREKRRTAMAEIRIKQRLAYLRLIKGCGHE